jgi:superfamily II DNA or RNA helicase/diadenosine tetraphosphate (Ap4A) HIT family hydrolase/SOS-response transcriptional repressor LexA
MTAPLHAPSPFLALPPSAHVARNALAFALRDKYPVAPGHTLVIPFRHIASWFDATRDEQLALLELIDEVKRALDAGVEFPDGTVRTPDGYNVGFNAGAAAGQTVMHLHVHVIPRYAGDMDDPRGGVRGVIPGKQKYAGMSQRGAAPAFAGLAEFVHGEELHLEDSLRHALLQADRADFLSAFVQTSGVASLREDLRDALARGVRIRLLTGDYFGITSPDALHQLLRLAEEHPGFTAFFYETEQKQAFHPKAYLFWKGAHGVAYVGSSNLSKSALTDGVEWNLRLVSDADADTLADIQARFETLLSSPRTTALTPAVIEAYRLRAPERTTLDRPGPARELRAPPPVPNAIQREALAALAQARVDGKTRGLVVLATGLGKTFLSAFDFAAHGGARVLFVAHLEEILGQAKDTWQAVFPDKTVGTYKGALREREVDLLFASVQTIARDAHLSQFEPEHFDYLVIDEFHHAAASTYRKLLGHFRPRFLLGLTATPERMDGRSLLELCDENLVFRRDLIHGISQRLLVPFRYFGVKDTVDFEPIPWRSGKFDSAALSAAVSTEARAEQALREYERHAQSTTRRTLCFCCTTEHADFMAKFFREHGKAAVAVHSGPTSASRAQALRDLEDGRIELVCAVDMFNEGLDIKTINHVLMLRPTESPVIFLQQLGRGLRTVAGKDALVIVDFIGNHRSFLSKPQSLLMLLGQDLPPRVAIEKLRDHTLPLPEGCTVDIETDALDLLASMVRVSAEGIALHEYLSFRDSNARRPTAAELFAKGVMFKAIRDSHTSWFAFVSTQGDLLPDEQRVLDRHAAWFSDLLRTKMTKAYKMTSLRALLDADALFTGADVEDNARRAFDSARADLMLFRELREDEDRRTWGPPFVRKWRSEPLGVWVRGESTSKPWFRFDGDRLVPTYDVAAEDRALFEAMTEELVDLRLAEHRDRLLRRTALDATQAPIILSVSHSSHRPILRFDRDRRADIPEGLTPVLVGGETLTFDFKKIAVNVATRDGSNANALPEVLRRMFGPSAGQPGIRHRARLLASDDGWRLERDDVSTELLDATNVFPLQSVPYYADVKVACGAFDEVAQQADATELRAVNVGETLDPKRHFVVRASGDSMDGGDTPICDGDLVLCEWTPHASAESIQGKPHLLVGHGDAEASFAIIKVPRKSASGWRLESWNPDVPEQAVPASTKLQPVARVIRVIDDPRGLVPYGTYDRDAIAALFASKNDPSWRVGHRDIDAGGKHHTVLMVTLRKPDQKKLEHRYADRFLSASEFQWESQASTGPESLKGRRIQGIKGEERAIHLFVQYDSHQPFTYLGAVSYLGHEGEKPMRVRFALQQALPEALWRMWG